MARAQVNDILWKLRRSSFVDIFGNEMDIAARLSLPWVQKVGLPLRFIAGIFPISAFKAEARGESTEIAPAFKRVARF